MLMKTAWSGFLSILVWVLMKPSQPKSIHSPICVSETFESNYEYLVHLVKKAGRNVGVTAATVSLYSRKVSRIVSVVLLALTILSVGIGYEISVNNQSADPANMESLSLWSQRACNICKSHNFGHKQRLKRVPRSPGAWKEPTGPLGAYGALLGPIPPQTKKNKYV